MKQSSTRFGQA